MLLAKVWYFCTSAGSVFVLPYFNVFFSDTLHFNKEQIGALSALRPWLSAGCQVLLCSAADWLGVHTAMLVATFTVSILLRCLLMVMPAKFIAVAALILAADCIGSPVGAIVDATVVGACKNDGDYGKHRMWGSIGWGGLSVAAGWLVGSKGLGAGFAVYVALSLPCAIVAVKLRKEAAAASAEGTTGMQQRQGTTLLQDVQDAKNDGTEPMAFVTTTPPNKSSSKPMEGTPDLSEDLTARLLQGSPCSSYAESEASESVHGGSCPGSTDIRTARCGSPLKRHCDSPFSRFAYEGPVPASQLDVVLASPSGQHPWTGEAVGPPPPADPAADSGVPECTGADEPSLAEVGQQPADNSELTHAAAGDDAAEPVPANSREATPVITAPRLATFKAVDAGTAVEQPYVTAVVAVITTKKSAKLDRSSQDSCMLPEPMDSQLEPKQDNVAGTDAAAGAAAADDEDEDAPLLNSIGGKVPPSTAAGPEMQHDSAAGNITIATLLRQPTVLVFLWRALIIGLGLGAIGNFLFLHVEELGGTGTLMGLMLAFNILTEAPAFHFQTLIMDKMSVPLVFNASMLMLALRLAGYGCLPWLHSPWPVLALELMHGFTFATSWGAGIVHCKRLAPPHLNASMQGLFSSLYGGLGSGLGALLGGFLMEALGGQGLFFVVALVVLGGWLLGSLVELLLIRKTTRF